MSACASVYGGGKRSGSEAMLVSLSPVSYMEYPRCLGDQHFEISLQTRLAHRIDRPIPVVIIVGAEMLRELKSRNAMRVKKYIHVYCLYLFARLDFFPLFAIHSKAHVVFACIPHPYRHLVQLR